MERKIGEIFEHNGEWYQCVKSDGTCNGCAGEFQSYSFCYGFKECECKIFKKLGKVGEPFSDERFGLVQKYELKMYGYSTKDKRVCFTDGYDVFIKLKQNKEDMGDNDDIRPYDELFSPGTASNTKYLAKEDMEDLDKIKVRDYTKVEELNVMEEKKLSLKPFDIQKAREGKPVCTRDGRKARIICFDRVGDFPIVALTDDREYKEEGVNLYDINGKGSNECFDLMMLPEKKEGWVNIDKGGSGKITISSPYSTKEEAIHNDNETTIDTIKISWEE